MTRTGACALAITWHRGCKLSLPPRVCNGSTRPLCCQGRARVATSIGRATTAPSSGVSTPSHGEIGFSRVRSEPGGRCSASLCRDNIGVSVFIHTDKNTSISYQVVVVVLPALTASADTYRKSKKLTVNLRAHLAVTR
jgi:hypothetical protein